MERNRIPRVFIPIMETAPFNTSAAEQYGERIFIFHRISPPVFNAPEVVGIFSLELEAQKFDPAMDFVALTGPTILVALFYALVCKRYDRVKTLMFDARSGQYVERIVGLGKTA
jgi:hypothetical protein